MRGLCRLTAGFLAVIRASTFVLPPEEAVDRLHDVSRDTLAPGQVLPPSNDDARLEIEPLDLSHLEALSANIPADEDEEDPVQAWLGGLEPSETFAGSVLSASLFPSMTLSSAIEFVTSTAEAVDATAAPSSTRLVAPPAPTPLDLYPLGYSQQKPLGGLGDTWRAAKVKAQSVVALIASHITNCPSHSNTVAQPGAATSISSTISARTVQAYSTGRPTAGSKDEEESYSSVVNSEPSSFTPPKYGVIEEAFSSVVDTIPTGKATKPSPAHFTPSSGAATATATVESPALDFSYPTPSPAVEAETHTGTFSEAQHQPSTVPAISSARDPRYILAIVLPVVLTVLLSCTIFHIIIRRNPRRFADSLARYEERKNRRLYQCAARKHQFEAWTQGILARPPFRWFVRTPTEDLVEKGLVEGNPRSSTAGSSARVSQEILSFREAHEFVNTLVQAEEGGWSSRDRRRTYMWLFGGRARRQRAMSNASSDLSDSEKSAPPPYDERDNFEKIEPRAYTRVARDEAQDSDKSSVSSIIPTSPRHSTYTFSTGDPDSDKE